MTTASTGFSDLEDWYTAPLGRRYLSRCWETLQPLLPPLDGRRILDAGCGAGHYSQLLARAGAQVEGIDPDSGLIKLARQRVPSGAFQTVGVEHLPFKEASFDAAICCNVLEFVKDPVVALVELRRVCRRKAVILVLSDDSLWHLQQQLARVFSAHPYYRGNFFSVARLREQTRQAGWQIERLEPTVFFAPLPFEPLLGWSEGSVGNACWVAQLAT